MFNRPVFIDLYTAPLSAQINLIKAGIGGRDAKARLSRLPVPLSEMLQGLQIPLATINCKARTNAPLAPDAGERVFGLGRPNGQLYLMTEDTADSDWDASAWLSMWLCTPVSALGGARPLSLLGTMTGQALISGLIAQMQSGAYA